MGTPCSIPTYEGKWAFCWPTNWQNDKTLTKFATDTPSVNIHPATSAPWPRPASTPRKPAPTPREGASTLWPWTSSTPREAIHPMTSTDIQSKRSNIQPVGAGQDLFRWTNAPSRLSRRKKFLPTVHQARLVSTFSAGRTEVKFILPSQIENFRSVRKT